MSEIVFKTILVIDDAETGAAMRAYRKRKGVSLREVARRLDVSAAYVSDLELGRRGWTQDRANSFMKAVQKGASK